MDKEKQQQFDVSISESENPLDRAFVADDQEDLGLDDSSIREEPSQNDSLLSSIKITNTEKDDHDLNINQPNFVDNMKEWSNDEASKFQAMLSKQKKTAKGPQMSQLKFTKTVKPSGK